MATPQWRELTAGETYLTVVCDNCKGIIPISRAGQVIASGPGTIRIGCPFCGVTEEHHPTQANNRRLEVLPPTAQ